MRNKQALTTGDVAKYCGVSFRTVIRWIEGGRLNAYRLPGRGDNRIHIDEFLRFLSEHDMPIPEELSDSQRKVLVIESESPANGGVAEVLGKAGFEIATAVNGFDAGCALETFNPAVVVISELNIPGLPGSELVAYIRNRQEPQQTRILVVSPGPIEELEPSLQNGADDFLVKPYSESQLVDKVAELANATDLIRVRSNSSTYAAL